jgi:hypothetical protein
VNRAKPKAPLWRIVVLLAIGALLVSVTYYSFGPSDSQVRIGFHPTRFGFGRMELTESESGNNQMKRFVRRNFGVFSVTTTETIILDVLGTNKLNVGDVLYSPTDKRELWRVLEVDMKQNSRMRRFKRACSH